MIKTRILFLAVFLLVPVCAFSQTSAAADKSWQSFWTQFSAAINSKSKAAVKRLMARENEFSSGGGTENRDERLRLMDKRKAWGYLQKSVRLGTKFYDYDGKPGRITKDNDLIFVFLHGQWRFVGPMGY